MDKLDVSRAPWRGGPRSGNARRQEIPIEEAIALSNEGTPYAELAARYGVSYGVVCRRMKDAGHVSPKNKQTKHSQFRHVQVQKRRVLNELGITTCQICGESRSLDYSHIVADRDGGPIAADNCLVLCPSHHRFFDSDSLTSAEWRKISRKVLAARKKYAV
jgi:ribosomal protein L37AE/L43A